MTTISEQGQGSQQRQDSRRDEQIVNRFAFATGAVAIGFGVYFTQVLAGAASPPPPGVVPLLSAAMTVGISIKICYWVVTRTVDCRMRQLEERHAEGEAKHAKELAEIRDDLRAIREALVKGDQSATATLIAAENHLNERDAGKVTHLPRVRPGL